MECHVLSRSGCVRRIGYGRFRHKASLRAEAAALPSAFPDCASSAWAAPPNNVSLPLDGVRSLSPLPLAGEPAGAAILTGCTAANPLPASPAGGRGGDSRRWPRCHLPCCGERNWRRRPPAISPPASGRGGDSRRWPFCHLPCCGEGDRRRRPPAISPPACGRGRGRASQRDGPCRAARPLAPTRPPPQAYWIHTSCLMRYPRCMARNW